MTINTMTVTAPHPRTIRPWPYTKAASVMLAAIIVLSTIVSGCSPEPVPPSPTVSNNTSVPTTTNVPSPTGGRTFAQVSQSGAALFASYCAVCHGAEGQGIIGPAVIGPNKNFGKYGTADVLLSFISSEMPQNAPGSLQTQQYLDITGFLLLENDIVLPDSLFDPAGFNVIKLPQTDPSTTTPTPTATIPVQTFEQAAVNGAAVFAAYCIVCHGTEGQGGVGPALIGPLVEMDDYGTADVLLGFIAAEMPQNAPGSLQTQQYWYVTAFLLVENNIVYPGNPFNPATFNGINLPD